MMEEKIKFFSLYYGLPILNYRSVKERSTNSQNIPVSFISLTPTIMIEDAQLELKDIENLTEEEINKCYYLYCGAIGYDNTMDFGPTKLLINDWFNGSGKKDLFKYAVLTDYLRSKGYFVPYDHQTKEDLIRKNWIKII